MPRKHCSPLNLLVTAHDGHMTEGGRCLLSLHKLATHHCTSTLRYCHFTEHRQPKKKTTQKKTKGGGHQRFQRGLKKNCKVRGRCRCGCASGAEGTSTDSQHTKHFDSSKMGVSSTFPLCTKGIQRLYIVVITESAYNKNPDPFPHKGQLWGLSHGEVGHKQHISALF